MTVRPEISGGAPVATLDALPEIEARVIRYLRQWCDGPSGQVRVWDDLATRHGTVRARACLMSFERVLGLLTRHGRRRLMRHQADCMCVGSDEAVFARLITGAATGEREDAMMIASLLIRADLVGPLVDAAQAMGLHLMRARTGPSVLRNPPSMTRH